MANKAIRYTVSIAGLLLFLFGAVTAQRVFTSEQTGVVLSIVIGVMFMTHVQKADRE